MIDGLRTVKEIENSVASDSINVEKYALEVTKVSEDGCKAVGRMFQQERLRCIVMITSAGISGGGKYTKGGQRG